MPSKLARVVPEAVLLLVVTVVFVVVVRLFVLGPIKRAFIPPPGFFYFWRLVPSNARRCFERSVNTKHKDDDENGLWWEENERPPSNLRWPFGCFFGGGGGTTKRTEQISGQSSTSSCSDARKTVCQSTTTMTTRTTTNDDNDDAAGVTVSLHSNTVVNEDMVLKAYGPM